MNRYQCCEDKTLLVSYLYGECSEAERRVVEEHLAECAACAAEVQELRAVRGSLSDWEPPERALGFRVVSQQRELVNEATAPVSLRRTWTPPWWLQAAAAVLLLATAVGLAEIEVRYGSDGLVVRTGWNKAVAPASASASRNAQEQLLWRRELAALEQELRKELSAASARSSAAGAPRASQNEAALLRRVQTLIDQSELKQQRELAVRLADVVRDFELQRRADQMRVQQTFGQLEGQTGVAVRQNRELLDYLVRVSQQR